jgi:hypothetical protein
MSYLCFWFLIVMLLVTPADACMLAFLNSNASIRMSVCPDGTNLPRARDPAPPASRLAPLHLVTRTFLKKKLTPRMVAWTRLASRVLAPPHLVRVPPAPRASPWSHQTRLALRSLAPRQLASIGRQQVDEHMLRSYVSCVSYVCCICFIWMLQK